jgi:hypothetical protein
VAPATMWRQSNARDLEGEIDALELATAGGGGWRGR